MDQIVLSYDLALGAGVVSVASPISLSGFSKVSFQADGVGVLTAAATVQLQESNTKLGTYKDITAGVATVAIGASNQYIDAGSYNSAFLQFNITGAATAGIITLTLTIKK